MRPPRGTKNVRSHGELPLTRLTGRAGQREKPKQVHSFWTRSRPPATLVRQSPSPKTNPEKKGRGNEEDGDACGDDRAGRPDAGRSPRLGGGRQRPQGQQQRKQRLPRLHRRVLRGQERKLRL